MKLKALLNLRRRLLYVATIVFVSLGVASAATITGAVTNGTTGKPSAGDAVVLISLEQRMQEVARTKSDARGHFSLELPDSGMHLVRVDHEKAAYFQPVPPNVSHVDVSVFDVAPVVAGVTTEANVMRVETDQQGLRVTQSFFIKNDSKPPRTQFSIHSYEIYLPPDARIEGSAAMGPGGMPVRSDPTPVGDKGHYAFIFPLRPGETQFQLAYHLPYSGSLSFTPRLATPADNFVVMLPKSMSFKPSAGVSFQPIAEQSSAQTFLVRNVGVSDSVAFTVSGSGALPRDTEAPGGQEAGGAGAAGNGSESAGAMTPGSSGPGASDQSAATDNRPGGGLGVPIDTPDPLNKYKWWILGGIALILAVAAGFLLRKPVDSGSSAPLLGPVSGTVPPAGSGNVLLAALKDELFAIETDRVQGKISDSEYSRLKAALELVLRRALSRTA